jgi:hypothetical protein
MGIQSNCIDRGKKISAKFALHAEVKKGTYLEKSKRTMDNSVIQLGKSDAWQR